ncbi:MAG: GNAT family N-acetyltransferase [Anaerolineales bacterium]|nr:GNAT family N-acetyltransferase [Anaerolineales bacterium]
MKKKPETEITVHPPQPTDARALENLLARARWKHLHQDWFETDELLELAPILIACQNGHVIACMSSPPEPERIGWLRIFAIDSHFQPEALWDKLWPEIRASAAASGIDRVAALCTTRWLSPILYQADFTYETDVIFLERARSTPPTVRPIPGRMRAMQSEDLDILTRLDHRAFEPIWRHSLDAMRRALEQAAFASVIELDGELLGYQISTSSMFGAHLARVAIDPAWQGKGMGTALVADTIHTLHGQGYTRISVNTQADNYPSQKLYEQLGFQRTGTRYPILAQRLHPTIA